MALLVLQPHFVIFVRRGGSAWVVACSCTGLMVASPGPPVPVVVILRAAALAPFDEDAEAVEDALKPELVGGRWVVGATVGRACGRADSGGGGVLGLVEDACQEERIRFPPLLVTHCALCLDGGGVGGRACGGLDEAERAPTGNCDPSYPDFCIPPPPPDLDCADIGETDFTVQGADPHGFDGDNDGVGCES
jgi:hypothetical protein